MSRRLGGLTSGEVARRLSADGPNLVPTARRTRLAERVLSQLRDPLVMVLLVAAVLTIATGDWTDAGVVLLVIVVNTAAGVTQEVRADQAIAALGALRAPEARVVRDGRERAVPARDVVVGDLLVLTEGAIVPADAVVVEAAGLLVDEAALTGESEPVAKTPDQAAATPGTHDAGPPSPLPAHEPARGRNGGCARPEPRGRHRDRAGERDGPDRGPDGHRARADPPCSVGSPSWPGCWPSSPSGSPPSCWSSGWPAASGSS